MSRRKTLCHNIWYADVAVLLANLLNVNPERKQDVTFAIKSVAGQSQMSKQTKCNATVTASRTRSVHHQSSHNNKSTLLQVSANNVDRQDDSLVKTSQ